MVSDLERLPEKPQEIFDDGHEFVSREIRPVAMPTSELLETRTCFVVFHLDRRYPFDPGRDTCTQSTRISDGTFTGGEIDGESARFKITYIGASVMPSVSSPTSAPS